MMRIVSNPGLSGRALAVISAALLLAACGSGGSHPASSPTTAASGTTATTAGSSPATSATTAAPATTASAPASPGSALCIVGNWTSTNYAQKAQGATTTGGAGAAFVFTATQVSVNFSGMQPISFSGGGVSGQGLYLGQEQATFSPTSTGPSTGSFTLAPSTSNVTFEAKLGSGSYGTPIRASGLPSGVTGTWTCTGSATASVTVPTPNGPTTVTLKRNS